MFLVIRVEVAHWWATFNYLTKFKFVDSPQEDEFSYYLATLEAALQHIYSGQLKKYLDHQHQASPRSSVSPESSSEDAHIWTPSLESLSLQEKFFKCIERNDPSGAAAILDQQVSPMLSSQALCHPLCQCSRCQQILNHRHREREELTIGVETVNDDGWTAVHFAAHLGHVETLDWLVEKGADINVKDVQGQTPLHVACRQGKQSTTLLLLHYMADPNAQDNTGNTPLHIATLHCHLDCVKALIFYDQGSTSLSMDKANDFGDRPLHMASKWGYSELCSLLLENGANPCCKNRHGETVLLVAHNLSIAVMLDKAQREYEETKTPPRHLQQLQSNKMDTEQAHHQHRTKSPTTHNSKVDKAIRAIIEGDTPMVKHHLGFAADDDPGVSMKDAFIVPPQEATDVTLCHPLCQCVKCAVHLEASDAYSEGTGNVNVLDSDGCSPLHVAARYGPLQLVQWLVYRGALVNCRDTKHDRTPLHLATAHANIEIVEYLLRSGSLVNVKDTHGHSPLHVATSAGSEQLVALLLQQNTANPNLQDGRGQTPLHQACKKGHVTCVKSLLEFGALWDMADHVGQLPCHLTQNKAILTLLRCSRSNQKFLVSGPRHLDDGESTLVKEPQTSVADSQEDVCGPGSDVANDTQQWRQPGSLDRDESMCSLMADGEAPGESDTDTKKSSVPTTCIETGLTSVQTGHSNGHSSRCSWKQEDTDMAPGCLDTVPGEFVTDPGHFDTVPDYFETVPSHFQTDHFHTVPGNSDAITYHVDAGLGDTVPEAFDTVPDDFDTVPEHSNGRLNLDPEPLGNGTTAFCNARDSLDTTCHPDA